jgi:hypothetical protein
MAENQTGRPCLLDAIICLILNNTPHLISCICPDPIVVPYTGIYCQGFIDYKVWIPEGVNVTMVEAASGLESTLALPNPCKSTFLSYACSVAFPKPIPVIGQSE